MAVFLAAILNFGSLIFSATNVDYSGAERHRFEQNRTGNSKVIYIGNYFLKMAAILAAILNFRSLYLCATYTHYSGADWIDLSSQ